MSEEDFDLSEEGARETPVLIKAYGEYWNPEFVDWESKKLIGRRSRVRGHEINVYDEMGVYVLYKDFQPVYVGKAERSIGARLSGHRRSLRKGPRWDSFSWFGIREILKSGRLKERKSRYGSTSRQLIATLEALLITVIDPKLNYRREKLKNAVRLIQSVPQESVDLDARLGIIEQKLDKLLNHRGTR